MKWRVREVNEVRQLRPMLGQADANLTAVEAEEEVQTVLAESVQKWPGGLELSEGGEVVASGRGKKERENSLTYPPTHNYNAATCHNSCFAE